MMENKNHKGAPENGTHKPVITVDYEKIDEVGDAKFLSIGRSTWDGKDYSAKVFRETNGHWSSKSEELPLWRVLDLATLVVSVINGKNSNLDEYIQDKEQVEELRSFISENLNLYIPRLNELKRVLNVDAMELVLDKVHFLPWIGKDYQNGGIFGKRILVLGESHYCGSCTKEMCERRFDDCRDFTVDVVANCYLNKQRKYDNWMKTFTCFERSLVGKWTDEESRIKICELLSGINNPVYITRVVATEKDNKAAIKAAQAALKDVG